MCLAKLLTKKRCNSYKKNILNSLLSPFSRFTYNGGVFLNFSQDDDMHETYAFNSKNQSVQWTEKKHSHAEAQRVKPSQL